MKLKVCGMKYQDNILKVAALKPDYMGFIFYDKSPRYVSGAIPDLPDSIKTVGVFVNDDVETVLDTVRKYKLDVVQLHGEESVKFCQTLQDNAIEIIKVFSIKDTFDFTQLLPFEPFVDYFLFDTKGTNPGGNGYRFDWNILKHYNSDIPYFLSGGIGLDHMEALNQFKSSPFSTYCHALDVNSKFELKPAHKDDLKLKQFINIL